MHCSAGPAPRYRFVHRDIFRRDHGVRLVIYLERIQHCQIVRVLYLIRNEVVNQVGSKTCVDILARIICQLAKKVRPIGSRSLIELEFLKFNWVFERSRINFTERIEHSGSSQRSAPSLISRPDD